jgi:hypothetical protein
MIQSKQEMSEQGRKEGKMNEMDRKMVVMKLARREASEVGRNEGGEKGRKEGRREVKEEKRKKSKEVKQR